MQVSSSNSTQTSLTQNPYHLTTQIEALQTQMNSLMGCIQNHTWAGVNTVPHFNSFQFGITFEGTVMSFMATLVLFKHIWVLDTGTTNHICYNMVDMHNLQTLQNSIIVTFHNGNTTIFTQIGSVTLCPVSLVITDVLYIPSFSFNLLFIIKLSVEINAKIYFF